MKPSAYEYGVKDSMAEINLDRVYYRSPTKSSLCLPTLPKSCEETHKARFASSLTPSPQPKRKPSSRKVQQKTSKHSVLRVPTNNGLIKLEVIDTGIGISKEARARLFSRYQQADSSISQ